MHILIHKETHLEHIENHAAYFLLLLFLSRDEFSNSSSKVKRRSVKRRISEGPPRVSFRGLFCGISQKRPYYPVAAADDPLRQQLRQLCGTSPCVSFGELCQAWIFVVQQVASFLSLSLSRTHHKALARGISTRGSRAKNGGARKKSRPLKTQSSLNRLLSDRWIAHNICRVCQSLHSKEREQIRSFHDTFTEPSSLNRAPIEGTFSYKLS